MELPVTVVCLSAVLDFFLQKLVAFTKMDLCEVELVQSLNCFVQELTTCTEVKLVDWEEYTTKDDPPRGEICVKTPFMITGYFGLEQETQEVVALKALI